MNNTKKSSDKTSVKRQSQSNQVLELMNNKCWIMDILLCTSLTSDHDQPTRWASCQGTKCVPGAWTPHCGSAPCCSCCQGSAPPPWLTAGSICLRTSLQTQQIHCTSPHTLPVRWPSSSCSVRRYGSAPHPGAQGHLHTPRAPPAEGSSVQCDPASPCWPSGQNRGGWQESRHRRRAETPLRRGRSTWQCWLWVSAAPKPPSCFSWWCESESGQGFRSPRQYASAPSGRVFQKTGQGGAHHWGDGSLTPVLWVRGIGLQRTGYLRTERAVRPPEWAKIFQSGGGPTTLVRPRMNPTDLGDQLFLFHHHKVGCVCFLIKYLEYIQYNPISTVYCVAKVHILNMHCNNILKNV